MPIDYKKYAPKMIGIYRIYNIINSKSYVGSSMDIDRRIFHQFYLLKKNKSHSPKLQNAFNKYKKENFITEILKICQKENLERLEEKYIRKFDSVNKGYNCSYDTNCATRGYKWSDESRRRGSAAQKIASSKPGRRKTSGETLRRYNYTQKGIPKSDSHKNKISESNMGKKMSADFCRKVSERLKANPINYWLGKKRSMEDRKKMSMASRPSGALHPRSKPIIQYSLSGKEIAKHISATNCEQNSSTFKRSGIKECLRGKTKTYKNYIWKYAN